MVAKEWNLTPDEFWDKPPNVQALMIAYVKANSDMDSYKESLQNQPGSPKISEKRI